ncbi:MAG: hypothetical protein QNK11_02840 [Legionella sp.]|nr:hypothetical protein [Legionella sp.]
MPSSHHEITQQYPTEKHNRFFFPTRPWVTLAFAGFFSSLCLLGFLSAPWAIFWIAFFVFDDLPLAPFVQCMRAINNLTNNRKTFKAKVILTSITLAALIGGLLAFFVLAHNPVFMLAIASFVINTWCSPIFIFLGGMLGAAIADQTKKITPLIGMIAGLSLGFIIGLSLPITIIPLMVNAVFITALVSAFTVGMLAKQGLKFYFRHNYGHSNADGYYLDDSKKALPEASQKLADFCKAKIAEIKQEASFLEAVKNTSFSNPFAIITWGWDEFTLKHHHQTNAYKDIYHTLMSESSEDNNVSEKIKPLLKQEQSEHTAKTCTQYPYVFSGERQSNLQARSFFHHQKLNESGGIPEELSAPFLSTSSSVAPS